MIDKISNEKVESRPLYINICLSKSYPIYLETLKKLEDEKFNYLLLDLTYLETLNKIEYKITNYLLDLTQIESWIHYIPDIYSYIIDMLEKEWFYIYVSVDDKYPMINLKLNPYKIKDFIEYLAHYYDVPVEDIELDQEYVNHFIYQILKILAESIQDWDKDYDNILV